MKKIGLTELLIFIFSTELIGVFSGIIAGNSFGIYSELVKPPISPPSWLFPLMWAILYALMGASAYIVYYADKDCRKNNLILYGIQLFFNFMWSIFFFRFQLFGVSSVIIFILILLVIRMIMQFGKSNKIAGYINIPYLIWLIFALYLNIGVFILN
ncbi:MAG: TspO/MBR family protein [Ruminococcus sp.]